MDIKQIILECSDLQAVKRFYAQRLRLPVKKISDHHIDLKAGKSILTFRAAEKPAYYHFAFNIPGNSIRKALGWIKLRAAILPDEGGNEIIDFPNWNARSVYFKDPVGNIVEFIARKNLDYNMSGEFDHTQLIEISEIGIPVSNMPSTIDMLSKKYGIEQYWGDKQHFAAMGNETGLLIVVNEEDKTWYPTQVPASSFPTQVVTGDLNIIADKGEIQLT